MAWTLVFRFFAVLTVKDRLDSSGMVAALAEYERFSKPFIFAAWQATIIAYSETLRDDEAIHRSLQIVIQITHTLFGKKLQHSPPVTNLLLIYNFKFNLPIFFGIVALIFLYGNAFFIDAFTG